MKVAYIISMAKGGIPAFTYREIDVLCAHGFQIAIFPLTYRTGPYMPKPEWYLYRLRLRDLVWALASAKITQPAKYFRLLSVALRTGCLREFVLATVFSMHMRRWNAQHIHCHFGDSKLYTGYFCAEWLGLPMTCTLHAYEIHKNPKPAMFSIAAGRCERIIVQSEFNKDAVLRKLGIPESRVCVIRAHGDMSSGDENAVKVLMVGEFREKKGHRVLFEAVKKLGRKDLRLWIVGDGALDVRRMAEDYSLSEVTTFFGVLGQDLLNVLYDSCDIYVQPSHTAEDGDSEGIPASLMEAMSHGKPVISTRHAGIPELVEEVIVEPRSADELAAAIARLADDPLLRAKLGERNRLVVKSKFSDAAVMELGQVFLSSAGGVYRSRNA